MIEIQNLLEAFSNERDPISTDGGRHNRIQYDVVRKPVVHSPSVRVPHTIGQRQV